MTNVCLKMHDCKYVNNILYCFNCQYVVLLLSNCLPCLFRAGLYILRMSRMNEYHADIKRISLSNMRNPRWPSRWPPLPNKN